MRQSPFVPLLALAGGFAIVPPALIHFVGGAKVQFSSTVHFWAVGLSASIAIVWLAAALVPALTMSYFDLGWWLGHGFEVAGILIVGAPVAVDLFRASPPPRSREALESRRNA